MRAVHLRCGGLVVLGQQRADVSWGVLNPLALRGKPTASPASTEGLRQDWILLPGTLLSTQALRQVPEGLAAAGRRMRAIPDALAGI